MNKNAVAACFFVGILLLLPWRVQAAGPLPLPGGAPAIAPTPVEIVPHRAVYAMSLDRAAPFLGMVAVSGTMEFEWADACDGWTVNQRYKLLMQYAETDSVELDINLVTWEAKDGKRYRFNVRKLNDGEPEEDLKGEAWINDAQKEGEAHFTRPEKEEVDLPVGTEFPSTHTLSLIRAGLKGERFLPRIVFDGSTQDGPSNVTAAIGKRQEGNAANPEELLRAPWWPVRLAFFSLEGDSETPDYELRLELQQNGIVRSLLLDYGDFVVRGRLETVEALEKPPC